MKREHFPSILAPFKLKSPILQKQHRSALRAYWLSRIGHVHWSVTFLLFAHPFDSDLQADLSVHKFINHSQVFGPQQESLIITSFMAAFDIIFLLASVSSSEWIRLLGSNVYSLFLLS